MCISGWGMGVSDRVQLSRDPLTPVEPSGSASLFKLGSLHRLNSLRGRGSVGLS